MYLWDWAEVDDSGQRFENMVACHLLKACHFWTDTGYGLFELHYLRDKQKNELDFLITKDKAPWLPIEVKLSDTTVSSAFKKFLHYLNLKKGIQVVHKPKVNKRLKIDDHEIYVVNSGLFLRSFV